VRVESTATAFTSDCSLGEELSVPVKHTTGRWFAPPDVHREIEAAGQVVLRYAGGSNPNDSLADVAGVANERGNVVGLMPHPEHAVDRLTGSMDGARLFHSLARHLSAIPA
jgi:phosphoribosylformylglycinamidine synthase